MYLLRQINSVIKSGAYAVSSMAKGQIKTTQAKVKLASSLTIFATSVATLGFTLLGRITKKINKKQKKKSIYDNTPDEHERPKKSKKQKPEKEEDVVPKKTKSERNYEKLQAELNKNAKNLEPIVHDDFGIDYTKNHGYGMPKGFYNVKKHLEEHFDDYLVREITYSGGKLTIETYGNLSKVQWELMTKGTLKGKPTFEHSKEEAALLREKHAYSRTSQDGKPKTIILGANGLYDWNGNNYFDLEDESEMLSRMSVDYNKQFTPFFAELINMHYKLAKSGFF